MDLLDKKCYIVDEHLKPMLTDMRFVLNQDIQFHCQLKTFDTIEDCEKYIKELKDKKKNG